MDREPLRARAAALIAADRRRTRADRDRLAAALRQRCWPGGATDRTEPVARGWVRRWGPHRLGPPALECTCARGVCDFCN
jgi:hypothetical protein